MSRGIKLCYFSTIIKKEGELPNVVTKKFKNARLCRDWIIENTIFEDISTRIIYTYARMDKLYSGLMYFDEIKYKRIEVDDLKEITEDSVMDKLTEDIEKVEKEELEK